MADVTGANASNITGIRARILLLPRRAGAREHRKGHHLEAPWGHKIVYHGSILLWLRQRTF